MIAPITTLEQALDSAYKWANSQPTTANKGAAKVYIEAVPMAEMEGKLMYDNPGKGRAVQLLYIMSNLTGWRGEEARACKAMLKKQYAEDK